MPNKKISQLTQANLPLTGTEELPIVQGAQTVKVRVQDIVGSSGVTEVTYTELQSLIASSSLIPGSIYKITGFNKNMPEGSPENPNGHLPVVLYDDGTDSGITIYLEAVTNNTLSESGHGEFYNPKYTFFYDVAFNPSTVEGRPYVVFADSYNRKVGENILDGEFTILRSTDSGNYYLINFTSWTQGGNGGGFSYTRQLITPEMDEPIISFTKTDYGSEVDVIEPGVLEITRGDNNVIYNAALESSANSGISPEGTEWSRNGMAGFYGIWDGDNPDNTLSYQEDQVVFWGGYAWKNLTGGVGFADNILTLNSDDWEKLPYTDTNHYEKVIDEIKVDLSSGILIGRTNVENQITVEFSKDYYSWERPSDYNLISEMGWGLYPGYVNNDDLYGINSVKSINSRCVTVNFKGKRFFNIDLNLSYVSDNYFGRDTYFEFNTLTKYSYIQSNTLTNNSYIYYNTLTNNGNIRDNTLTNNSDIRSNTLNDGSYIENNTLSDYAYISVNKLTLFSYVSFNVISGATIDESTINTGIGGNVIQASSISSNTITVTSIPSAELPVEGLGILFNKIYHVSQIDGNTLDGAFIVYNQLDELSNIVDNDLEVDAIIFGNELNLSSQIINSAFTSFTGVTGVKLYASLIDLSATVTISGNFLRLITIRSTELNEDLSSATDIFLETRKEIFTRLDGTKRLMYYNTSDTPTIVNVNA